MSFQFQHEHEPWARGMPIPPYHLHGAATKQAAFAMMLTFPSVPPIPPDPMTSRVTGPRGIRTCISPHGRPFIVDYGHNFANEWSHVHLNKTNLTIREIPSPTYDIIVHMSSKKGSDRKKKWTATTLFVQLFEEERLEDPSKDSSQDMAKKDPTGGHTCYINGIEIGWDSIPDSFFHGRDAGQGVSLIFQFREIVLSDWKKGGIPAPPASANPTSSNTILMMMSKMVLNHDRLFEFQAETNKNQGETNKHLVETSKNQVETNKNQAETNKNLVETNKHLVETSKNQHQSLVLAHSNIATASARIDFHDDRLLVLETEIKGVREILPGLQAKAHAASQVINDHDLGSDGVLHHSQGDDDKSEAIAPVSPQRTGVPKRRVASLTTAPTPTSKRTRFVDAVGGASPYTSRFASPIPRFNISPVRSPTPNPNTPSFQQSPPMAAVQFSFSPVLGPKFSMGSAGNRSPQKSFANKARAGARKAVPAKKGPAHTMG